VEITSENEFYDYTAKYTKGMCHHIIPARIAESLSARIKEIGMAAYRALGCSGLSRLDFMLDREGAPKVIEVNTLPGMTEMSLFPDSARFVGISFEELVDRIVDLAEKKQVY
jgi:D-alanine-D-alanine ligase